MVEIAERIGFLQNAVGGAKGRSWSESATCRVQIFGIVDDAMLIATAASTTSPPRPAPPRRPEPEAAESAARPKTDKGSGTFI